MNIKFKKLKVGNRFNESFENWVENNEIVFSDVGFANVYAPNGVGKSSLAKALKNEINSEYEYEINGKKYTEKTKDNSIMVIDDFFFRNIATREGEKLSDYILGTQIKKELELKANIEKGEQKFKEMFKAYLKKDYLIKTKDCNLCSFINDEKLKKFINAISNFKNQAKEYDAKEILNLVNGFKFNEISQLELLKLMYVKENLEIKNSIIIDILNFKVDNIKEIKGFSKLDIDNDAIDILNKHKNLKTCIFDEKHILSDDTKEQLENNKNLIVSQLDQEQKKVVNKILNLKEEPFGIKDAFNEAFETGKTMVITNLKNEIKEIILEIENEIMRFIINTLEESKLKELYDEYNRLIDSKIELTEDDEMLLKDIIENCINKKVNIERDDNKNIIFTLGDNNFIGKSRQELPLSTGEQNFISLYFDLLAAKNSNKDIIIIDDPISSFDSIYKNKIIYSIIKVLGRKKKVLILTHNINTIKLMHHQYRNCFNLYLLKNEKNGENGFIKINKKEGKTDELKDMDLMLEIKNIISLFKKPEIVNILINKEQFLISIIPFMRSYSNLINIDNEIYKKLCVLMHGYENEKIDINEIYKELFGQDILQQEYIIDVETILNIEIEEKIIDESKYPLLNRTLWHNINYLKLRLMVENTLYCTDKMKMEWYNHPQLHKIIEDYLKNKTEYKNKLLSKKTLLNEFNHFEYDMCLFMPSLDISDSKLIEEKSSIISICQDIKNNGIK